MASGCMRLWRGEAPLGTTFWLYYLVPTFAASAVIGTLLRAAPYLPLTTRVVLQAPVIAYGLALLVPVWRSAARHRGHVARWLARGFAVYWTLCAPALGFYNAGVRIRDEARLSTRCAGG
jgi:hypothetical protein